MTQGNYNTKAGINFSRRRSSTMNFHIMYDGLAIESFTATDQKAADKYVKQRYTAGKAGRPIAVCCDVKKATTKKIAKIAKPKLDKVTITSKLGEIGKRDRLSPTGFRMVKGISYTVNVFWKNVDRPHTASYSFTNESVAKRLKACIEAGAAYSNTKVTTDNAGQTYVDASINILMRTASADLRRLGF
jgi:hypothetical protein